MLKSSKKLCLRLQVEDHGQCYIAKEELTYQKPILYRNLRDFIAVGKFPSWVNDKLKCFH